MSIPTISRFKKIVVNICVNPLSSIFLIYLQAKAYLFVEDGIIWYQACPYSCRPWTVIPNNISFGFSWFLN